MCWICNLRLYVLLPVIYCCLLLVFLIIIPAIVWIIRTIQCVKLAGVPINLTLHSIQKVQLLEVQSLKWIVLSLRKMPFSFGFIYFFLWFNIFIHSDTILGLACERSKRHPCFVVLVLDAIIWKMCLYVESVSDWSQIYRDEVRISRNHVDRTLQNFGLVSMYNFIQRIWIHIEFTIRLIW